MHISGEVQHGFDLYQAVWRGMHENEKATCKTCGTAHYCRARGFAARRGYEQRYADEHTTPVEAAGPQERGRGLSLAAITPPYPLPRPPSLNGHPHSLQGLRFEKGMRLQNQRGRLSSPTMYVQATTNLSIGSGICSLAMNRIRVVSPRTSDKEGTRLRAGMTLPLRGCRFADGNGFS